MENRKDFDEFNEKFSNEFNTLVDENNTLLLENDYEKNIPFNDKPNLSKKVIKNNKNLTKKQKNTNIFRLISSFVTACAVAAMVQTSFTIPLFSYLFHPQTTTSQDTSTAVTYSFDSKTAGFNDVSYSVTIDGEVDYKSSPYSIMLLEKGNDSTEYINAIPFQLGFCIGLKHIQIMFSENSQPM